MLPSQVFAQAVFVTVEVEESTAGSVSVTVFVAEQLFASVSVRVNVPAHNPLTDALVKFPGIQE